MADYGQTKLKTKNVIEHFWLIFTRRIIS